MARSPKQNAKHIDTPLGTWTILLGYAAVIAVLWGYMYLTMLLRR
ncbi:MAG TPA: hypothetical protein VIK93_01025 [Limnochordales bacterium]